MHEHILANIHPDREAALVRKSRESYKKKHGVSEAILDGLFGPHSRGK
jgi:hypothetical protein